jgi:hypothetical protein
MTSEEKSEKGDKKRKGNGTGSQSLLYRRKEDVGDGDIVYQEKASLGFGLGVERMVV